MDLHLLSVQDMDILDLALDMDILHTDLHHTEAQDTTLDLVELDLDLALD